MVRKDKQG